MIKRFILLAFLFVLSFCKAQDNPIEKISIHFRMFKAPNVTYTIDFKKLEMTCVMLEFGNVGKPVFDKKYTFKNAHATKFLDELNKDMPESTLRISQPALDGGGYTMTYFKADGKKSELIMVNAQPDIEKFKMPLRKIEAFFKFAYSVVSSSDIESVDLLDASYSPYFFGLPVKLAFNNPLQYKIWGSMSGGEYDNKEFFDFLNALPRDKCVIIDCANHLSYALQNAVLKSYIIKYPNLKFINNDYLKHTRESLLKIQAKIRKGETKDLEKDADYLLYMSDTKAMDKWLSLPETQWNMNISGAIKSCQ
jgi:hypothetical protein